MVNRGQEVCLRNRRPQAEVKAGASQNSQVTSVTSDEPLAPGEPAKSERDRGAGRCLSAASGLCRRMIWKVFYL